MKIKNIHTVLFLLAVPFLVTSCELFGLDFQESYDFDYDKGLADNRVNMTTYDFISSRSDIFSLLKEAIDYVEMQNDFKQSNVTYILPTNKAISSEEETDKSYFQTHQISYIDESTGEEVFYAPISMTAYPKEQIKEFLLYHIVKGQYTFTNMPAEPTWYPTCAVADTAYVNLYILKDRNPNIVFNNFDGHYKGTIKPRTANLYSTVDGSYIHVLDSWLDRPKRDQIHLNQ